MKFWFPNWIQWIVMWIGLAVLSFLLAIALDDPSVWAGVVFALGAFVFIVWMIEGWRRKI